MIRGLLARRSCSVSPSTVLVPMLPIQMASNCWLPAFKRSCSAWIAAYCGEDAWLFRPCERTVARGFVHTCFTLANVAKPVLQGTKEQFNARSIKWKITICTTQNDYAPSPWQLHSRSVLATCSLAQNNHAHSGVWVRQSFWSYSLRKCGIVYSYLCQPTDCIPLFRKSVKQLI